MSLHKSHRFLFGRFFCILHLVGVIQGFDRFVQDFIVPIQAFEGAIQGFSHHFLKFIFFTQFQKEFIPINLSFRKTEL